MYGWPFDVQTPPLFLTMHSNPYRTRCRKTVKNRNCPGAILGQFCFARPFLLMGSLCGDYAFLIRVHTDFPKISIKVEGIPFGMVVKRISTSWLLSFSHLFIIQEFQSDPAKTVFEDLQAKQSRIALRVILLYVGKRFGGFLVIGVRTAYVCCLFQQRSDFFKGIYWLVKNNSLEE